MLTFQIVLPFTMLVIIACQQISLGGNGVVRVSLKAHKMYVGLKDKKKKKKVGNKAGAAGVEPVKKYRNMVFYGEVGVGTPPQMFKVQFDTGSPTLWILSSKCQLDICKNHSRFNAQKSSTFKDGGGQSSQKYVIGEINGTKGIDVITLGDLKIKDVPFVEVNSLSPDTLKDQPMDGLMGLSMKTKAKKTLPYRMFEQKVIHKPIFGMYLINSFNKSAGGEIVFGDNDPKFYKGKMEYFPVVTKDGRWVIRLDGVKLNGQPIINCNGKCRAHIDSGTTFINAPTEYIDKLLPLLNMTKKEDGVHMDCSKINNLPPLTFTLSGKPYSVSKYAFKFKDEEKKTIECIGFDSDDTDYSGEDYPPPQGTPSPQNNSPQQKGQPQQKGLPQQKGQPQQKPLPQQNGQPQQKPSIQLEGQQNAAQKPKGLPQQKGQPQQKPLPQQKGQPQQKPSIQAEGQQKAAEKPKGLPQQKAIPQQKGPLKKKAKPQKNVQKKKGKKLAVAETLWEKEEGINEEISNEKESGVKKGIVPPKPKGMGNKKGQGAKTIEWVLGDGFLTEFYTEYDFGQKRIGFARVKNQPNPEAEEQNVE